MMYNYTYNSEKYGNLYRRLRKYNNIDFDENAITEAIEEYNKTHDKKFLMECSSFNSDIYINML